MVRFTLARLMFEKNRIKIPQLHEMSGVNKNTLYAIYNDKAGRVDLSVLDRLCTALSCQPGDLLEYVPEKPTE